MDKAAMQNAQKEREAAKRRCTAAQKSLREAVREFREATGAAASAFELGVEPTDRTVIDERVKSAHSEASQRAVEYAQAVQTYVRASKKARKETQLWGAAMDAEARRHLAEKFGHTA
jgi:tryptophan synthase alpha subunit